MGSRPTHCISRPFHQVSLLEAGPQGAGRRHQDPAPPIHLSYYSQSPAML